MAAATTLDQMPDLTVGRKIVSPLNNEYFLDVSEQFRPKLRPTEQFRTFDANVQENSLVARAYGHYLRQHREQTVATCTEMRERFLSFNHAEMDIMTALTKISDMIDASDPDVDVPNIYHCYQTAERIRAKYPNEDWFQLVGLIHDLGKVLAAFGLEHHWVAGDTYPLGCAPADSIVFVDSTFGDNNDRMNPKYNSKYGMYEPNCGVDNLLMTFGHDEYMYQVLKNHPSCTIPDVGLYMIRFHSFYPWHTGGDYWHLADEKDRDMLHWIREFNKFDLYSKGDELPDIDALKDYYTKIAEKYVPGKVKF